MLADLASDDTRQLVKRAADELLAGGERPTVASVRSRIGRGSASTINEALREWWQELSRRLAAARARPDLPQPVADAADQLWGAALTHAHEALAAYRVEADNKVAAATQTADAALLARDEAEKRFQTLQQQYTELEQNRLDLDRRFTVEAERRQAAEARIQEIQADAERRVAEVRERVHHLEEMLERERTRCDSTEQRLTLQVEEYKTARSKMEAKYKGDVTAWRDEKNKLLENNQQLHQRSIENQSRIAMLQEQLGALQNERSALHQRQDQLVVENAELRAKSTQSQKLEESLCSELTALRQTIRVIEEDRETARRDLEITRQALADKLSHSRATT